MMTLLALCSRAVFFAMVLFSCLGHLEGQHQVRGPAQPQDLMSAKGSANCHNERKNCDLRRNGRQQT
eukprot:2181172-Amphidinium_carterae.1